MDSCYVPFMPSADGMNRGADGGAGDGSPPRLVPEMASLRLLALNFVRHYIGKWGGSPSYGEIASALGTNRTRVRKAIKSLTADGLLLRRPGPRGLALPSDREAALRMLRSLGWVVDEEGERAMLPPVTNRPLLPPPALDYIGAATRADIDGSEEDHAD